MSATQLLAAERADTIAFLEGLSDEQWEAGTLCEGWRVIDLVSHMVAREHTPVRYVAGFFTNGRLGEKPSELLIKERQRGKPSLLRGLRRGPPLVHRLPGPSVIGNFVENWVHNEDLRRGELDMPRQSSPAAQDLLWSSLHVLGRMMLAGVKTPGVIAFERPNGKALALAVGTRFPRQADPRQATAALVGEPGEIVLFLLGRKEAADVELRGEADLVSALRNAKMSL